MISAGAGGHRPADALDLQPAKGAAAAFTVITAGTRTGNFAAFNYPSNLVTMQMSNTPVSVVVRVLEVSALSPPTLLTPELLGPDLKLTWTSVSNVTYRVEFLTDLNATNWTPLPGDILSLTNTTSRLDLWTPSNRVYRVRRLP